MAKGILSTLALSLSALSYAAPHPPGHVPTTHHKPTPTNAAHRPMKTLIPAVHWDHDFRDYQNLVPRDHSMLYFAEQPGRQNKQISHAFLKLNATFAGPTVVTEHSEFITKIDCSSNSLYITLGNDKAFEIAKDNWTGDNVKFLTYSDGCAASDEDARTLWDASDVSFSRRTNGGVAHVKYSSASRMDDGLVYAKMVWGAHHAQRSISSASLSTRNTADKHGYRCQPPRTNQGVDVTNWCKPNFDNRLDSIIGFKTVQEEPLLAALKEAAHDVSGAVSTVEKRWHPEFTILNQDISLMLDNNADSPFGPAYQIYHDSWDNGNGATASVGLYCQDCGVNGHIEIGGEAEFGIFEGVVSVIGKATGQFHAGVKLELDAQAQYQKSFEQGLLDVPIGGFSVLGLVNIGPSLSLNMELGFDAKAHGQIIAGAALDIGPFDAGFDLISGDNHADNFEPQFSHSFDAHGEISVEAELKLPVKLGVEISIPLLKFKKAASIVDAPGVKADADFKISTGPVDPNTCNGLSWSINLENQVYLEITDFARKDLVDWVSPPLGSGCIPVQTPPPPPPPDTTQAPPPPDTTPTPPPTDTTPPPDTTQTPPPDTTQTPPPTDTNTTPTPPPTPVPKMTKLGDGGKHNVYAGPSGNFYLTPSGGSVTGFIDSAGALVSDNAKRYFHFYHDVMDQYGVSRMRLSTLDQVPRTAGMFALVPVDVDSDGQVDKYVAVDTESNVYNVVVCQMIHQSPKLFLEKAEHQYSALYRQQLIWSVTGGEVTSCRELSLAGTQSAA